MQRWEYRVISLEDGQYTARLNAYGADGWELVSVVSEPSEPEATSRGRGLPMPRAIGRIEDAAAQIGKLDQQEAPARTSTLLWVLRRPLDDD